MNAPRIAAPTTWFAPRPTFLAVLAYIGGRWALRQLGVEVPSALFLSFALLAFAAALVFRERRSACAPLWVLAFALAGAAQESQLSRNRRDTVAAFAAISESAMRFATVEGIVSERPRRTAAGGWMLFLEPGATVASAGASVTIATSMPASAPPGTAGEELLTTYEAGDRIALRARVYTAPQRSDLPATDRWMRSRNAVTRARVTQVPQPADGSARDALGTLRARSNRWNEHAEIAFRDALTPRGAALLGALVLGRTERLDDTQRDAYARTGLIHLFSISGFHTMVIGALTLGALRRLGLRGIHTVALFGAGLALFAFAAGLGAPVLRASLLLAAAAVGDLLRRPVDALAALSSIALAFLLLDPALLDRIDFQLSYLGAAAMVAMTPLRFELREALGPRLGWGFLGQRALDFVDVFALSAAIQLIAAPMLAEHFGMISIVAPLANAVLAAPAAILVAAGVLLGTIAAPFPEVAMALLVPLDYPLRGFDWAVRTLGAPRGSALHCAPWAPATIGLWYAILLTAPVWLSRRERHRSRPFTILAPVLGLAALLAWTPLFRREPSLTIWFLDVGQGDAIVLRARDGTAALVDAGRDESSALRMLEQLGIDRLAFVVATHADADHIGGMTEVLRELPVGTFVTGGSTSGSAVFADLLGALAAGNAETVTLRRGDALRFGNPPIRVAVLHPTAAFISEDLSRNDASLVLRVETPEGASALLTGDAEELAENDLLRAELPLAAQLLKAGHHGSRSSTTAPFLDAVAPRIAIISAGRGNSYGHPAPRVLADLAARNIAVWRTDQQGTIRARAEGAAWLLDAAR